MLVRTVLPLVCLFGPLETMPRCKRPTGPEFTEWQPCGDIMHLHGTQECSPRFRDDQESLLVQDVGAEEHLPSENCRAAVLEGR